jgi:hypothetical protein
VPALAVMQNSQHTSAGIFFIGYAVFSDNGCAGKPAVMANLYTAAIKTIS